MEIVVVQRMAFPFSPSWLRDPSECRWFISKSTPVQLDHKVILPPLHEPTPWLRHDTRVELALLVLGCGLASRTHTHGGRGPRASTLEFRRQETEIPREACPRTSCFQQGTFSLHFFGFCSFVCFSKGGKRGVHAPNRLHDAKGDKV